MISRSFCFICIFGIATTFRIGTSSNRIVDHFTYIPRNVNEMENGNEDVQWEFFVIGKRVPWNEAQSICPIYGDLNSLPGSEEQEMGYGFLPDPSTREAETDTGSTLAVFDEDTKDWLARMLSESNYRYDGLWIGGRRKDSISNWTWIDTGKKGDTSISNSLIIRDYPAWHIADNHGNDEKNCLTFDRLNHEAPVLVPDICQHRKPFICMRPGRRRLSKEKIIEGNSVFVDGQQYTLYQVIDEDEEKLKAEGVRKVNGGGITWKDARLQCKKRGKHLAMIFTNEAAIVIANTMLRSRPSIESVWLDGRCIDGIDCIWVSSGFTLLSKKSNITSYPPWSDGHPILPSSKNNDFYQEERCLILDRHLCAEHTTPVFIDLDCQKKRPFVCQNANPEISKDDERYILIDNKRLIFSFAKMTWNEGEVYCQSKSGHIANILDAKTLSVVLKKMTELGLDHVWVDGRTVMSKDGWKWVDENGEVLSRNDIGAGSSWCFDGSWPYTDREICLNLDREGHGTPLFYGLPCNTTNQYVLCNLSARKSVQSKFTEVNETKVEGSMDIQQQATDLAGRIRKLAKNKQSGLLFVMDDSLSVLNTWFAEEMKLATTIIRRYFPLSQDHPMGMITFSQKAKIALALNQTDTCNVLISLSKDMLANRADRISADLDGVVGKETNLINAALLSVDTVRASNIQQVIIVFVTDGEHVVEDNDKENLRTAMENLQNLRNDGHEAFAIVVSQGQKYAADYNVIEELFSTSLKGERNLYFVENYKGLAEMNSALNLTGWTEDYAAQCGEIQWIIPKENEMLAHLLQSKK
ncbi:hypothetical protein ACS0PU_008064 [Formica fusca]